MPTHIRYTPRRLGVILFDIATVFGTYFLAFLLRFDFNIELANWELVWQTVPFLITYIIAFHAFSLYRGIYYFSSFADLLNITKAVTASGILTATAILFIKQAQFPRAVLLLHPILAFLGVCGTRFGIRLIKTYLSMPRTYSGKHRNVLLVGAGELGESLLRQMLKTKEPCYNVVGFIDDDMSKWGMRIHGRPVFGGTRVLCRILEMHQIHEVVIAIASRRGEIVRTIIDALRNSSSKPELKIAPGLDEMLKAPLAERSPRQVRPADLLNRDIVKLDLAKISESLANKVVLVTGAGGTIGSELSRQVLQYNPSRLVLVESHATSLFYIESELQERAVDHKIVSVLGDIRDQVMVDRLFSQYKPTVVLHAAAHKHVHQLEFNVQEGVGNNILGTYYVARAAQKYEAEAFLLVSTDKAVKPSSVMGATKRVAELIVKNFSRLSTKTRFVTVRFGNVLGSSGSVLEIFQRQISAGGPITVTHPDVKRYFMTVEESVQLILQAISMAKGGEIFILKMGTPVKILDMAKNLILLSGLEPARDIEIRFTGLKQGEKLDEDLMEDPSICDDSGHPSIMILRSDSPAVSDMESWIIDIGMASRHPDPKVLVEKLKELAPSFAPAAAHQVQPLTKAQTS
ncbi:MAG: polysaccharide biosynthesis protein [Elusimicrobia bacterium]|nr:polysaccharide biosynthesis protein [Elusimicrobiota bacterium]